MGGADRQTTLLVDRTAGTAGLNVQPASTTLEIACEVSADGGLTFPYGCVAKTQGGIFSDPETGQQDTVMVSASLPGGVIATNVRGRVTVAGAPVSVSGTLSVS